MVSTFDGHVDVRIEPPDLALDASGDVGTTFLMEKVSHLLEVDGPLTKNQICKEVRGNKEAVRNAISLLEAAGHVNVSKAGNSHLCSFLQPYTQPSNVPESAD